MFTSDELLRILRKEFKIDRRDFIALMSKNPFELLVATVLSQNTNDKNSSRALEELRRRIGTSPEDLAGASEEEIAEAIRIAGLYRTKAKALKKLAEEVMRRYSGNLERLLDMPVDEARKELMSLPKVGEKTADVFLLFLGGKPTFPIDTHVRRVSKRMGIAEGSYEDIRRSLMKFFNPEDYLEAHLLLIALGRRYCRAKNPACDVCPLRDICPKLIEERS